MAGLAGVINTTTHAVVWKPNGNSYTAIDLGVLPGTTSSEAIGIDNLGRVVGWSTTLNFPPNGSPFMWTEAGGMVDLSAQGFPDEMPLAISPGGAVATLGFWYQLGNPTSVGSMPPSPAGILPAGNLPDRDQRQRGSGSFPRVNPAPRIWSISSTSITREPGNRYSSPAMALSLPME